MLEKRTPRGIEMNDMTSNGIVLEQKPVKRIAIVHEATCRRMAATEAAD